MLIKIGKEVNCVNFIKRHNFSPFLKNPDQKVKVVQEKGLLHSVYYTIPIFGTFASQFIHRETLMTKIKPTPKVEKSGLHPKNPHRFKYDFKRLINVCPELEPFVIRNKYNNESVDFANPEAVKALNKAILKLDYKLEFWDIPANYLCPPIPGRADYLHHAADLLASCNNEVIPTGPSVSVLDIGVGANCIYPIIGHQTFGWHFVGSDIDPAAIQSANQIVNLNPPLCGEIELRLQPKSSNLFSEILKQEEVFDLSICNPPFHSSPEVAAGGTLRKLQNLSIRGNNTKTFTSERGIKIR